MDPAVNPFSPGAGTQPPVLAGRDGEIKQVKLLMRRFMAGRHERSLMIVGLRGVGKTVLLRRIEEVATSDEFDWAVDFLEVPNPQAHQRPFRDNVAGMCRRAALQLGRDQQVADALHRFLRVLRSFRPKATPSESGQIEFSVGIEPLAGLADSGDLYRDLGDLFIELGKVAKAKGKGVILLFDEVQYLDRADLSALVVGLHHVSQKGLPVTAIVAGLPTLPVLAAEAQSYAERLFDTKHGRIGQIGDTETRRAFTEADLSVVWEQPALDLLVRVTDRYPHFIQEWGKQVWDIAPASPIREEDVKAAHELVMDALDVSLFHDRLERATPKERELMRAMASLGDGPDRIGDVAAALGVPVQGLSMLRARLMKKGLIYTPDHGQLAFTIPHFADYLRRHPG